ncbi:MAG: ABC transporter ATP-binding protein [Pseudomonadota bacterium]
MLLEVKNLEAGYGKTKILHGITLDIREKEIVGLIGHNGAGKSTTLKTIFGLLRPYKGNIAYMNREITFQPPAANIERGIYFIPQDQFIFSDLTVRENLEISFFTVKDKSSFGSRLEAVYELFPILKDRRNQWGGTLSGGERRILSMGMGLLRQPKLLILDEPSSGLSPITLQHVTKIIRELNNNFGTSILLVEQNVKTAFKLSNRVYVMKTGRIILEETGEKLLERKEWWDLF